MKQERVEDLFLREMEGFFELDRRMELIRVEERVKKELAEKEKKKKHPEQVAA